MIRVNRGALTGDARSVAVQKARDAHVAFKAAQDAQAARKAELLAADETYQQLRAATDAALAERDKWNSASLRQRVDVLRDGGWYAEICASGDTLADAIDELRRKKAADAERYAKARAEQQGAA